MLISEGETKQVVSDVTDRPQRWTIEVLDGPARLGHSRQEAVRGRRVKSGYQGTVTVHRDDVQGVWAFAPEGAEVEVHRSGFDINLFPRRVVERPGDAAARRQDVRSLAPGLSVSASSGSTATVDLGGPQDGDPGWWVDSMFAGMDPVKSVILSVQAFDYDAGEVIWRLGGPSTRMPYQADPAPKLRPGRDGVRVEMDNRSSSSATATPVVQIREDS